MELPKNTHIHLKRLDFHAALGQGTNNLGEIWAIGMAIQSLQISVTNRLITITNTHIFSDSELALGAITNTTKTNKNNIVNYEAITAIKKERHREMTRQPPRQTQTKGEKPKARGQQ